MRVQFLADEQGSSGPNSWRFRKGQVVDVDKLPSGQASAWRWIDMGIAKQVPEEKPAASPSPESGLASPAGNQVALDAEEAVAPPKRRGRPPKSAQAEVAA